MDEKSAQISALKSTLSGESGDVVRLQAEQEKTTALLGLIQKELKASEDEREQAERTLKELRQMAVSLHCWTRTKHILSALLEGASCIKYRGDRSATQHALGVAGMPIHALPSRIRPKRRLVDVRKQGMLNVGPRKGGILHCRSGTQRSRPRTRTWSTSCAPTTRS